MSYSKAIELLLLSVAIIILSTAKISYSSFNPDKTYEKISFFSPVINKLLEKGADSIFIFELLSNPKTNFNEKYVKINITGYLNKTDYSHNYNQISIRSCKKFLAENYYILNEAEIKYDIPKEIITSILWIESKHGTFLGENHIPSVFFSTAMADQERFINLNLEVVKKKYFNDNETLLELQQKIEERAKRKSEWALDELINLNKIYNSYSIDVQNLKGSWAGAFGLSQFLPSSYINYAIDGNKNGITNLFEIDDAIFSISNYLNKNGWGKSDSAKRKAIFNYNNSNDYVDAVLNLAAKIK